MCVIHTTWEHEYLISGLCINTHWVRNMRVYPSGHCFSYYCGRTVILKVQLDSLGCFPDHWTVVVDGGGWGWGWVHDSPCLTHLHEGPVGVHLLAGLQEVASVRPHGRMLLCDDGRACGGEQRTTTSQWVILCRLDFLVTLR